MSAHLAAGTPLAEALANAGLRPKHYRPETEDHILCPKCRGGRSAERSLALKIDRDSKGAVWHCHRATCGYGDSFIIGEQRDVIKLFGPRREPPKPAPYVPPAEQYQPDVMYSWFENRGLTRDTVDAFGCYRSERWFHRQGEHLEGLYPAYVFPYTWGGKVYNRKYRGPHKQMAQEKDAFPTLFNVDAVIDPGHLVFVEGELDCMAVHQAGWRQVVSLKDGAPKDVTAKIGSRLDALETHAELLETIERIYLAGDTDAPGIALREILANRFGRQRCWLVRWPGDCKDANDVLLKFGADTIADCIQNAVPYPIEDVQEITGQALDDYLQLPPPRVLTTGLTALDQIVKLPGEGRLIVITGVPNSGKSQLMMDLMVRLMIKEDRRFLVFSPEMQPWEEFATQCAQLLVGKAARKTRVWLDGDPLMTREERRYAGDWLQQRLRFLASDADHHAPTLEWILQRGTESALRLGITDLVVDPWNEIEHRRGNQTDTDYIAQSLQRLRAFNRRHGANVWIIVHPVKMRPAAPGEKPPPPGPYDINGSANWYNKTDIGLTVDTPEDQTTITLWKSRFNRWGRRGMMATVGFDAKTGRYASDFDMQMKRGIDLWSISRQ